MKIKNKYLKNPILLMLCMVMIFSMMVSSNNGNIHAEDLDNKAEETSEVVKEEGLTDADEKENNDKEDNTSDDIDENATSDINVSSNQLGVLGNNLPRTLTRATPSLELMNQSYDGVSELDEALGIRFSTFRTDSNELVAIIERGNPGELKPGRFGNYEIPKEVTGQEGLRIRVVGIRKEAFKNAGLSGKLVFYPESVAPLSNLYIGDYAFQGNQITAIGGRGAKQVFETGRAGKGLFMDNKLTKEAVSYFFSGTTNEVMHYAIPSLSFANNGLSEVNLSSGNLLGAIGVMAFANNQITNITGLQIGVTIYSGAFYNNKITTDVINSFPEGVIFASGTTDMFGGDSKKFKSNGSEYAAGYSEGLGAFQKNLLTTVPTSKPGWQYGYRTFAANNIGVLFFNTALMNASIQSEGVFIANPITKITFALSNVTRAQAEIPKEFVANKTSANVSFRECPDVAMFTNFSLVFHGALNARNEVVPMVVKEGAFRGTDLKKIYSLNYVTIIEKEAFAYCNNLSSIDSSSGTDVSGALRHVYSIGDKAFYKCHNLAGILLLPNRIKIGEFSFAMTDTLTDNVNPSIEKGKLTNIILDSTSDQVPNIDEFKYFDVGKGAFAYQNISKLEFLGASPDYIFNNNLGVHIRDYAFAYNKVCNLLTGPVSDTINAGRPTYIYSKSFIGNQLTHYNAGKYGVVLNSADAFLNQNITGLKVKQDLANKKNSLSLAGYGDKVNGLQGSGMFTERARVTAFNEDGSPISDSPELKSRLNNLDNYIEWMNYKPNSLTLEYDIKNANGDTYNGAKVVTNFKDLKFEYEIRYQIGNINNDKAWFGNSLSTKHLQKYVSEGLNLIAPATIGTTLNTASEYAIAGWYDNPECAGEPISIIAKPTTATTVYAKIGKVKEIKFHSGLNAEFGSIGSGVREKILKVPEGQSVKATMDGFTEAEKNEWKVAFDAGDGGMGSFRRSGEWLTSNEFLLGRLDTDGSFVPNEYAMNAPVTDATPKNLYADIAKFKEINFHSVSDDLPGSELATTYGQFKNGTRTRTVTIRHGATIKEAIDAWDEEKKSELKVQPRNSNHEVIKNGSLEWRFRDSGLALTDARSWTDLNIEVNEDTPTDFSSMIIEVNGNITLHAGSRGEFGTQGSNIRSKIIKKYTFGSLTELIDINNMMGHTAEDEYDVVYDLSKYELSPDVYTTTDFNIAIGWGTALSGDYETLSDVYFKFKDLNIDDVIIPDPDNPTVPTWGVEVPREIILKKDENVNVVTTLVSLTGFDSTLDSLNVNLYIRSTNGMRLKRNDSSSTEALKYQMLFNGMPVEGNAERLIGTFNRGNKIINGTAKVLENGNVLDTYRDNVTFRIAKRILP